jgi:hypothetical protein
MAVLMFGTSNVNMNLSINVKFWVACTSNMATRAHHPKLFKVLTIVFVHLYQHGQTKNQIGPKFGL